MHTCICNNPEQTLAGFGLWTWFCPGVAASWARFSFTPMGQGQSWQACFSRIGCAILSERQVLIQNTKDHWLMGQCQFKKITGGEKVSESRDNRRRRVSTKLQIFSVIHSASILNVTPALHLMGSKSKKRKDQCEQLEWFILIILEKDNSWSALVVKSFNTRKL